MRTTRLRRRQETDANREQANGHFSFECTRGKKGSHTRIKSPPLIQAHPYPRFLWFLFGIAKKFVFFTIVLRRPNPAMFQRSGGGRRCRFCRGPSPTSRRIVIAVYMARVNYSETARYPNGLQRTFAVTCILRTGFDCTSPSPFSGRVRRAEGVRVIDYFGAIRAPRPVPVRRAGYNAPIPCGGARARSPAVRPTSTGIALTVCG